MYTEEWQEWRPGYEVSTEGRIFRHPSKRWNGHAFQLLASCFLTPCITAKGYMVVNVLGKTRSVHRIIATVFLTEGVHVGQDVNHKDGDKTNNRLANLEWVDRKGNLNHAVRIGLVKVGEEHHSAKISENVVREIIRLHKHEGLGKSLIRKHHFPYITESCIQSITDGRNWKYIPR